MSIINYFILGIMILIIISRLFLKNFKIWMIMISGIIIAFLGTFIVLYFFGLSLNTISMLAFLLFFGILIDISSSISENIFRHNESGKDSMISAEAGINEMAYPVFFALLIMSGLFIPFSFLSGFIGTFFKAFFLSAAVLTLFSLIMSLSSIPILAGFLFYKNKPDNSFGNWIREIGNRVIIWLANHKALMIIISIIILLSSITAIFTVKKNFINYSDSSSFTMELETCPGLTYDVTDYYTNVVEDFLKEQKDIESFYSIIQNNSQYKSTIYISMKNIFSRKTSTREMMGKVRQFLKNKTNSVLKSNVYDTGSLGTNTADSSSAPIKLNITGEDMNILDNLSENIFKIFKETKGIANAKKLDNPFARSIIIKADSERTAKSGISINDISNALNGLIPITQYSIFMDNKGNNYFVIQLQNAEISSINDNKIKNLVIQNNNGRKILLSSISDVSDNLSINEIRRENNQRTIRITASTARGVSITKASSLIKYKLKSVNIPKGYAFHFRNKARILINFQFKSA